MDHFKTGGHTEDMHGFSGAFSWWRNHLDYKLWVVANHTGFGQITTYATVDDFGNLVAV